MARHLGEGKSKREVIASSDTSQERSLKPFVKIFRFKR